MSDPTCTVEISPGRNVWLLARTDRDAASTEDVIETAAAYMVRVLGGASPSNTRGALETVQSVEGERRYYIGAARPVEITASTELPTHLPGEVIARREECPEPALMTVDAQSPWWVVVQFDWRGRKTRIPWPRRRVNFLGVPSSDEPDRPFDWLLIQARYVGTAVAPDSSLLGDIKVAASDEFKAAKKQLEKLASSSIGWLFGGLVIVGVAYAIARGSSRHGS